VNVKDLEKLIAKGESKSLELKKSTAELQRALQSVCAFANASGGRVLIGVKPSGELVGQQVSEQTLHEIAAAQDRFEPPVAFGLDTVALPSGESILVLSVSGLTDSVPFTYEGRAYERVENTTRKMSQKRYEALLLDRAHSRRRWENQEADELTLRDIDSAELSRIVEAARSSGRLVGPVGRATPDLLDRLGVRRKKKLLRAAVVLFGKTFLPDYPQCELRMARFRGNDKTEFLDQRQLRAPAFKLLEEAELFCQRHFPLPGRIEPGKLQRVDRPLIPPDAMREILVNAFIHRDYTVAGGAVSLAIFDDRVEVWSAGRFPTGITPQSLSKPHPSIARNPIIADVFHRAGLIEKWGRGTNRVVDMCREAGIAAPAFSEVAGSAVVTFKVAVAARPETRPETRPESTVDQRVLAALVDGPLSKSEIAARLGMKGLTGQLHRTVARLLGRGAVEQTIPEKPTSRLQKYRLVREKGTSP
jgi:ATP-dependent DNA helicase RecG